MVEGYIEGIRAPTIINNKGLHLTLPTIPDGTRQFLAVLACSEYGREEQERLAIRLRDVSANGGRYVRVDRHKLEKVTMVDIMRSARYSSISITRGKAEDFAPLPDDSGAGATRSAMEGPVLSSETKIRRKWAMRASQAKPDKARSDQSDKPGPQDTTPGSILMKGQTPALNKVFDSSIDSTEGPTAE